MLWAEVFENEYLELFSSLLRLIAKNDVCNSKRIFICTFELGNKIL